nr:hypothetical protein [Tanacetum cinerariifolium]
MLLMEAKEKGAVLDAEAEAFVANVEYTAPYDQPLAITTTNIFEVSHEDAYDSDVDEGPHAAAAFMANLSSTSGTNGATTSYVNEVHTDDNQIFDNVNHLLAHEMHQEEHLDSDVLMTIRFCIITTNLIAKFKMFQLSSNPWYAKQAKIAQPTLYDDHALLKPTNTPVRVHDSEESLVQAEVYWLPAEELATQKSNMPKPVTPFVHTRPTPSKVRVKPATRASKPMSKSDTRNHSTLPTKREKARKVEDHHRNLNKQNHVDSRLNVKRTGFVLNSNTVCNACNESLVFANLHNCVVRNLKSVNVKTPTAKHNVKTTKKVWKAKLVTFRSQWKPTG